jgi:phosphatidate phosphatase
MNFPNDSIVGIPTLLLFLMGKPYERGFNCDDESIRYPYKDNTISSGLNYAYSTTIPIITVEFKFFFYSIP